MAMFQFKPGVGTVIPNKPVKQEEFQGTVTALKPGPSWLFESSFPFDQATIISKCENYAKNSPTFNQFNDQLEVGNAGSTAGNFENMPHTWPELRDFLGYATECARKILESWKFVYDDIGINRSWINRHQKGGWTNWHAHHHADLVLVAYLKAPPNSGNLVLADPMEYHWSGMPVDLSNNHGRSFIIKTETNKIVFMAPFIRHSTETNNSDEDRWVLSVNFKTKIKEGK
jgi:hypothetical protein